MRKVSAFDITGNVFNMIFNGKAILTVKKGDIINSMTISWGALGYLWKKPTATMYLRPQRYTCQLLMDGCDSYTLSFLGSKYEKEIEYIGRHSGRDVDKYKETGLTPVIDGDSAYIAEADTVIFCKKMYTSKVDIECAANYMKETLKNDMYPNNDNHYMIYGEITKVLKK